MDENKIKKLVENFVNLKLLMKFDKTILIIGDTGMLGSELITLKLKQVKVFGCSRNSTSKTLDILDFNKTIDYLDDVNPDILINW